MAGDTCWLLLFVLGMVLIGQANAAGDAPLYVVVTVCVVYVIIDIALVVALVLWCYKTRSHSCSYNLNTARDKYSPEFVDANVQLQLQRKSSGCSALSNEYEEAEKRDVRVPLDVIKETDFGPAPDSKPESSITPLMEAPATTASTVIDNPPGLTVDYEEEERKEEEDVFPNTQSFSVLNKSFEERQAEGRKLRQNAKRTESETPLLHDNKSHSSEDDEEEQKKISPSATPRNISHSPSPKPEDKLVSITSGITGAILPPESPPKDIPKEIQSLDVSTVGKGVVETSFNEEEGLAIKPSSLHFGTVNDNKSMEEIVMNATPTKSPFKLGQPLSPCSAPLGSLSDGLQEGSGMFDDFLTKNNLLVDQRSNSFSTHNGPSSFVRSYPHLNNSGHRSSVPNLHSGSPMRRALQDIQRPRPHPGSASTTPVHRQKFLYNK